VCVDLANKSHGILLPSSVWVKGEDMNSRLHLRRCHKCHHLNEAKVGGLVQECEKCHHQLMPFFYYDEGLAMGLKTEEEASLEYRSTALPWREYPPIFGLTVYWDS
jgi:hypothetical protein